jgi:putative MATE family efflux protein
MPRLATLTEGSIPKTLVLFSLPILLGNVLQSLNGSVNSIWVGSYLGEAALTATSNANVVMFLLIGAIFGMSMAATILVAQHVGALNYAEAKRVTARSTTFFIGLSLLVAIAGAVFVRPLLALMQTPPAALPLAETYMRIIFAAVPFIYSYAFLMGVLRGAGDARTPFLFLLVSVALDIALNPLLIFGWGPVPRLGIAGSAWASLIAQAVSLVALVTHLYRRKHFLCVGRHELHLFRIDWEIIGTLVRKGIPMGLQMIVVSSSMVFMITLVNRFGIEETAAYGAAMQLWSYIQMPAIAIGAAVTSMAAQNVGAGNWSRVGATARTGVAFAVLLTGALATLMVLFDRPLLGLFLPATGPSLPLAMHINAIGIWSHVIFGVSMVLFGVVRSTGAVVAPLVLVTISLWFIRIPFAALLLDHWQAEAIWWSFPLSAVFGMAFALLYYRYGGWRAARLTTSPPPRSTV